MQVGNLLEPPEEETRQMRCTGRKRMVTDYSKLIDYDENDEIDSKLQPSPNKRKKTTNQLTMKAL